MSKDTSSKAQVNPWIWIVGVAIIALTVIIIYLYSQSVAYETLRLTTDKSDVAESPINAVLQSQLFYLGSFVTVVLGAGFGGYKIYKKLNAVEKQTNGRTHLRDQQLDILTTLISNLITQGKDKDSILRELGVDTDSIALPTTPPENDYTDEERELNKKIAEYSMRLSEVRKERKRNA